MLMVQEAIEATSVLCVIGGSMGGMQALEWAIIGQEYVRSTIVIGCNSMHTAWQVRTPFTQSLTLSLSLSLSLSATYLFRFHYISHYLCHIDLSIIFLHFSDCH